MFVDNSLCFNGSWTTPQGAITATADGTSIIDITGAGSGNAPAMINGFPATNTSIGEDYGLGDGVTIPHVYLAVTTTGTGSGTLTVSVSAAPDNGSYSPGTYTQIYQSKAFTGTGLVSGDILSVPLPPTLYTEGEAAPRFYKITYTISGTVGAVKVTSGTVLNPQSSLAGSTLYNENFLSV